MTAAENILKVEILKERKKKSFPKSFQNESRGMHPHPEYILKQ